MSENITSIDSPIFTALSNTMSYSQKVSAMFGENINTTDKQNRTTARIIEKKMDFLDYNLEKMMDLPKIPNFDRTEATSIALGLDRIREKFSNFNKTEMKSVLEVLDVLRK